MAVEEDGDSMHHFKSTFCSHQWEMFTMAYQETAMAWRSVDSCDGKSSWCVVMDCTRGRKSSVPK